MARPSGGGKQRGGGQRGRQADSEFIEKVVAVNRVSKVVKGGKRMSFSALVVVGDGKGKISVAVGKAKEVAEAIRKGITLARKTMIAIELSETTIPHEILGHHGGGKVLLKPASHGTGVIAGGPVRAVCEACGIKDILTKSLGSANKINIAYATWTGLKALRSPEMVASARAA